MTKEQAIKEYNSIIESRKSNPPMNGVYTETHHIVPRSCGGKDDEDNLVVLTAQEHYRAHELLPFIYACGKKHARMVYAWNMMSRIYERRVQINANEYAMLREEWSKICSKDLKQRWEDTEFASKMSEESKKRWEDTEFASKMSEERKKRWEDPEYYSKISRASKKQMEKRWEDSEYASKMSRVIKKLWEDPEYASKMSEERKKRWEDPEYASKMSEVRKKQMKKLWKDSEFASKTYGAIKKRWEDPEYASKMSEVRKKQMKKQWKDSEFASKMSKILKENGEKCKKPVIAIFSDGKEKVFSGVMEASRRLGCNQSAICACARGRRKIHHGIRFRYADDNANATTEKTTQLAS